MIEMLHDVTFPKIYIIKTTIVINVLVHQVMQDSCHGQYGHDFGIFCTSRLS